MSEPLDPAMDGDAYAAALDRFLDGLDDLDAGGPADAQVRADTEAIARGLGLIGGALSAEGAHRGAAAAAPAGTVVAMSSWRSKLNPRVLAAAASLFVVIGVGIPLAVSSTGGGDSDEMSSAQGAPEVAADTAGAAPQAESDGGDAFPQPGAVAGTTGTGSATAGAAAEQAPAAAAPMAAQDSAAKSGNNTLASREEAARRAAAQTFANDVACARAIFVGTITGLQPMPDGQHFTVSFLVEDWIVPDSGPMTASYEVLGSTVNSPGLDENTVPGQRRLFLVPASPDARMYAYREKDWAETKKQIAAVRKDRAGEGC
jgi:hypothetical protein